MYRKAMEKLIRWKEDIDRKPLILNGARQVGKTWILKEFGNKHYTKTAYINMDNNQRMKELFGDFDTERLIQGFRAETQVDIEPENTLIILYVLGELKSNYNIPINYWSNDAGQAEVDFIIQWENKAIPIEVKAEENLQSKSLKVLVEKYRTECNVRTAMVDYKKEDWLINIPLYCIENIEKII